MSVRALAWSAALSLAALTPAAASAGVPSFCFEYNDQDQDGFVYGITGTICPRDDCNDMDASIHPGAAEVCGDNVDQDCDGADLPCPGADDDRDGFRARTAGGDDCDDRDPAVHPGVTEVCGDGKDNDCVGGDQPCATDTDHDGYPGLAAGGTDCDDADPSVHPHAAEVCGDGRDQDCAGGDVPCARDADGDGHPSPAMGGDDCDDYDRSTHPGAAEVCGDRRDQDCSGADLECPPDSPDADGDGVASLGRGGQDCNDGDSTVHPGASEVCGDHVDQDCDGVDRSCGADLGDGDGDGSIGPEAGGDDCNDSDAAIYPGAREVCSDGKDQDCDGADAVLGVDAACATTPPTNPAFDSVREGARIRTGPPAAAPSCLGVAGPRGEAALLLALLALGLRRRR